MSSTHPMLFSNLKTWCKLLGKNKHLSIIKIPGILLNTTVIIFLTPVRLLDQLIFESKIEKSHIHPSTFFVLGYWRSETNFLQTLLSKDSAFGYLSGYQAFMPGVDLTIFSWVYNLLQITFPKKNVFEIEDRLIKKINTRWSFSFEYFNYTK